MGRPPRAVDLRLSLPTGGSSHAARIADALLAAVRSGALTDGDPLPSSRRLAAHLGLSRGAVVAAYDELSAAGFLQSLPGSGTRVAAGARAAVLAGATSHAVPAATPTRTMTTTAPPASIPEGDPEPRWNLVPGRPDPALVDQRAWRRAWRWAAAQPLADRDDGMSAHRALREQLAVALRRRRGVAIEADEVIVVPGTAALLPALVRAIGEVAWGMEDPGYLAAWAALRDGQRRVQALRIDAEGLDPAAIAPDVRAVYVTPAHQYPLGGRLSVARRGALLAWAHAAGGLLVEDDYDGEFRYDVPPLPPLRAMAHAADHVVYIGTASKLFSPMLRLAWVVPPARLRAPLLAELARRGLMAPEITGLALAHLLESGAWAAHHARCARTYAARRAALVTAFDRAGLGLPLAGIEAGLHVVARLPGEVDDAAVAAALRDRSVLTKPLSAYAVQHPARGLVLGYATLPESRAPTVVEIIAETLRDLGDARGLRGASLEASGGRGPVWLHTPGCTPRAPRRPELGT